VNKHNLTAEYLLGYDCGVDARDAKIQELIDGYYTLINIGSGDPTVNCIYANVCRDLERLIEVSDE